MIETTTTEGSMMPMSILLETDSALKKFDSDLLKTYVPGKEFVTGKAAKAATTAPTAKEIKPLHKSYQRPNGEVYLPRSVKSGESNFQDVAFVETAYEKGLSLLLYGPPGTGKTALVEAALDNVVTVLGSIETEAADFVGSWVQQTDGTYLWVDGPALVAAENGWPMLIDEIALIDPRQLSVVYSLMDGRNEISVTANPDRGKVSAKPGFLVFGATNPNVPGAVMSEALLSRFSVHVEMQTDWKIAAKLDVPPKIIEVARNLGKKAESGIVSDPPQLREVIAFKNIAEAFSEDVALENFISMSRPEDRVYVEEAIKSVFGKSPKVLTF
jgi:nitric oxide reductase NorQ protein